MRTCIDSQMCFWQVTINPGNARYDYLCLIVFNLKTLVLLCLIGTFHCIVVFSCRKVKFFVSFSLVTVSDVSVPYSWSSVPYTIGLWRKANNGFPRKYAYQLHYNKNVQINSTKWWNLLLTIANKCTEPSSTVPYSLIMWLLFSSFFYCVWDWDNRHRMWALLRFSNSHLCGWGSIPSFRGFLFWTCESTSTRESILGGTWVPKVEWWGYLDILACTFRSTHIWLW